ncbi:hypothetical protein HK096_005963 [Nowakowskiella sp. JEL0078]|nr:hypothetical protein HK096_005963 [Nowakowskiella sp. JEL0078]
MLIDLGLIEQTKADMKIQVIGYSEDESDDTGDTDDTDDTIKESEIASTTTADVFDVGNIQDLPPYRLTKMGEFTLKMSNLFLNSQQARFLIATAEEGCLEIGITVTAFMLFLNEKRFIRQTKEEVTKDVPNDVDEVEDSEVEDENDNLKWLDPHYEPDLLLPNGSSACATVVSLYEDYVRSTNRKEWCINNQVHHSQMKLIHRIRKDITKMVEKVHLVEHFSSGEEVEKNYVDLYYPVINEKNVDCKEQEILMKNKFQISDKFQVSTTRRLKVFEEEMQEIKKRQQQQLERKRLQQQEALARSLCASFFGQMASNPRFEIRGNNRNLMVMLNNGMGSIMVSNQEGQNYGFNYEDQIGQRYYVYLGLAVLEKSSFVSVLEHVNYAIVREKIPVRWHSRLLNAGN